MPRKKKALQREHVERRVERMKDVPAEQRSQTAERMFEVSQKFRAALYKHVPRPYPGRGVLLVSSNRAQVVLADTAFWPNHLGSMQHAVLGTKHSDVFGKYLAETARFVRDALE
jgi:hypothetical protein